MITPPSREQMAKTLSIIDSAIPRLKSEFPEEEQFWPAFAGMADQVIENLTETDGEWAYAELDAIMHKHGLSEKSPRASTSLL